MARSLEDLVNVSDANAGNVPTHFERSDGTWHMVAWSGVGNLRFGTKQSRNAPLPALTPEMAQ
ncbi:MAG: hypothetical protein DRH23_17630 [Deltaproteobacteria bacterium]|nr:MAG: hypothetical protein DRH23_17630 [Deltaproteobacteria bacterium]